MQDRWSYVRCGTENTASSMYVCVDRLTSKNPWSAFMASCQIVRNNYMELQCALKWDITPKGSIFHSWL